MALIAARLNADSFWQQQCRYRYRLLLSLPSSPAISVPAIPLRRQHGVKQVVLNKTKCISHIYNNTLTTEQLGRATSKITYIYISTDRILHN